MAKSINSNLWTDIIIKIIIFYYYATETIIKRFIQITAIIFYVHHKNILNIIFVLKRNLVYQILVSLKKKLKDQFIK